MTLVESNPAHLSVLTIPAEALQHRHDRVSKRTPCRVDKDIDISQFDTATYIPLAPFAPCSDPGSEYATRD